jgi:RNA polymerase-binding transcription factor DksA
MTDIYEQASDIELLERERLQEWRLSDALARANVLRLTGTAQDCDECGDPIPADRRAAAPGCAKCIACKQRDEAQHKLAKR